MEKGIFDFFYYSLEMEHNDFWIIHKFQTGTWHFKTRKNCIKETKVGWPNHIAIARFSSLYSSMLG